MKIVHVITRLILGGAQENTVLTVEGLHHRYGDQVVLVTGPAEGPEGDLFERVRNQGLRVEVMPELVRPLVPTTDFRAYRKLRKLISRERPDVVHTHSSKAGILGRAAAWHEHVPAVVHTIHGLAFGRFASAWRNALYIRLERWAAKRCHKIVSVCDSMTEQALAARIGHVDQYRTVYSGMEVEGFLNPPRSRELVRSELGLKPDEVAFGTVARLFELKGHEDILAIAPRVIQQSPKVKFVFIGDGVLREPLEREVDRLGLRDSVIFTGLVPSGRIPELLGAIDGVVHPSLREGLARVLPQGLIVGRPVVSYDIDGAKEVVLPETGFLIQPRDLDALAEAILRLSSDPTLRARLGAEGRRRFADQFRHETMTRQLREIYQHCLWTNGESSASLTTSDPLG